MRRILLVVLTAALLCGTCAASAAQRDFRAAERARIMQQASEAYEAKEYARVEELLRPLAEGNEPYAAFVLGLLAARGEGQIQDVTLAEAWWKKSAAAGNALAQFNLGYLHFKGAVGVQDFAKARELWTKAARQKQADALFGLGVLQANGLGGPEDLKGAVRSYREAAALGHSLAEYELGMAFLEGKGLKADKKKARDFLSRALNHGVAEARNALEAMEAESGAQKKPEPKKTGSRSGTGQG